MNKIKEWVLSWLITDDRPRPRDYKEYTAWCHDCSRSFVYYSTTMDEPDYECPRCNSNKHVTVP